MQEPAGQVCRRQLLLKVRVQGQPALVGAVARQHHAVLRSHQGPGLLEALGEGAPVVAGVLGAAEAGGADPGGAPGEAAGVVLGADLAALVVLVARLVLLLLVQVDLRAPLQLRAVERREERAQRLRQAGRQVWRGDAAGRQHELPRIPRSRHAVVQNVGVPDDLGRCVAHDCVVLGPEDERHGAGHQDQSHAHRTKRLCLPRAPTLIYDLHLATAPFDSSFTLWCPERS
mmetsp:Transcript_126412/g.369358  ORF Transcript_126412/g.369358 Transcript_126412/m.369358 type:complete len:230 (+) Transcript_126412:1148-1837(+)